MTIVLSFSSHINTSSELYHNKIHSSSSEDHSKRQIDNLQKTQDKTITMSSAAERKNPTRSLTPAEVKQVMRTGLILSVGAIAFMIVSLVLVGFDIVNLYPNKMNADILKGFAARTEYTLRYQTLLVTWLLANVLITIYGRITTKALNPLDENTETSVQMIKCILTNSFESIIISVFSQLIFVTFAEPAAVLKFIPLINIIQFIGRLAFFAGYPLKRAFGYMCTIWPNIILCAFNTYKLGEFMLGN